MAAVLEGLVDDPRSLDQLNISDGQTPPDAVGQQRVARTNTTNEKGDAEEHVAYHCELPLRPSRRARTPHPPPSPTNHPTAFIPFRNYVRELSQIGSIRDLHHKSFQSKLLPPQCGLSFIGRNDMLSSGNVETTVNDNYHSLPFYLMEFPYSLLEVSPQPRDKSNQLHYTLSEPACGGREYAAVVEEIFRERSDQWWVESRHRTYTGYDMTQPADLCAWLGYALPFTTGHETTVATDDLDEPEIASEKFMCQQRVQMHGPDESSSGAFDTKEAVRCKGEGSEKSTGGNEGITKISSTAIHPELTTLFSVLHDTVGNLSTIIRLPSVNETDSFYEETVEMFQQVQSVNIDDLKLRWRFAVQSTFDSLMFDSCHAKVQTSQRPQVNDLVKFDPLTAEMQEKALLSYVIPCMTDSRPGTPRPTNLVPYNLGRLSGWLWRRGEVRTGVTSIQGAPSRLYDSAYVFGTSEAFGGTFLDSQYDTCTDTDSIVDSGKELEQSEVACREAFNVYVADLMEKRVSEQEMELLRLSESGRDIEEQRAIFDQRNKADDVLIKAQLDDQLNEIRVSMRSQKRLKKLRRICQGALDGWRKLWCSVRNQELLFYHDQQDVVPADAVALNSLDGLRLSQVAYDTKDESQTVFVLLYGQRNYCTPVVGTEIDAQCLEVHLKAPSPTERTIWVQTLTRMSQKATELVPQEFAKSLERRRYCENVTSQLTIFDPIHLQPHHPQRSSMRRKYLRLHIDEQEF